MAELLNLGLTGLLSTRTALTTIGHNITNANTPSYSREQINFTAADPQQTGAGYVGEGVKIAGIERVMSEFVNTQLRINTSLSNGDDTYSNYASQVDDLLGNPATGVSSAMQQFFGAVQTASSNPESLPARQAVLSQSDFLAGRFNTLYESLNSINTAVNTQLSDVTGQVTQLASSIAQLNTSISSNNAGSSGQAPNDLLDKRDELLRQLSELVDIKTANQDDGSVNVFFSSGQPLVVGATANKIDVQASSVNSGQLDVILNVAGASRVVTSEITGGKLGGALNFRSDVLAPTFNQLGLTSTMIADVVNKQHALGMNLNNQTGGLFFNDINSQASAYGRVSSGNNNNGAGSIYVNISDTSKLTADDYTVKFVSSSAYQIVNNTTGAAVSGGSLGGGFPQTVKLNGLDVVFATGGFAAGDSFTLSPTHYAARDMELQIHDVKAIALAAPIRSQASETNLGSGAISQGQMLDASTADFATPSKLSPPIIIMFTSPTTYDVLDNTDPNHPVNLVPPLVNQPFVPGVKKDVFATDPNQTGTSSDGTLAGSVQNFSSGNGYPSESYTFFVTDKTTGAISTHIVSSAPNATAQSIAATLNTVSGVTATARTFAQLTNITNASALTLSLNGQTLVGVTADAVAASVNSNTMLKAQGIMATSDGTTVTLRSRLGVDLSVTAGGGAGDSVDVVDASGTSVTVAATNIPPTATVGGVVDVLMSNVTMSTTGNGVFSTNPTATPTFHGYQITLSGAPKTGDRFTVDYNTDGATDNRNGALLAKLDTATVSQGAHGTIGDIVSGMIEFVGTKTNEAKINSQSSDQLLQSSQANRESISGVNLDEEAAQLLQFQQAYTAAARLITVGQQIFDTLLTATGR